MRILLRSLLGVSLAAAVACPAVLADDLVVPTGGPLHGGGAPIVTAPPNCPPPPVLTPTPSPTPTPAPPSGAPDPFAGAMAPDNNFDASQARGTSAPETAAETLLGDNSVGSSSSSSSQPRVARIAFNSAKITENESAAPLDRVFATFNYYDRLNTPGLTAAGVHPDLYRETVGFEKTCLDGAASIGLRVPFFQTTGSDGILSDNEFGDIDVIVKYALYRDADTGNVLSGGLVVTVPTGPDITLADGSRLHSTLLQPYAGYICNAGKLYVEGFSAIIVPTDSRDVSFWTNDVGVGYRCHVDPSATLITRVVPTVELHLTDPLNHRGFDNDSGLGFPDLLDLTAGAHIGLGRKSTLTVGVATPLTGPRPFDFEVIAQFNCRF